MPGRLERPAALALEGERVDDDLDHPAHEPWAVATNRRGELGGVLFVLWDGVAENYRSLSGLYERRSSGEWAEVALFGVVWPGNPAQRLPAVPARPLAGLFGLAESGGEDGGVYLLAGLAAAGVTDITELGAGGARVPASERSGAFLAMGASASGLPPALEVRLGGRREVLSVPRSSPDPGP